MATKERAVDAATLRARSILIDVGAELRRARTDHDLSLADVGKAARISASQVSRIERGLVPLVPLSNLARLLAVVGLELNARAFPGGRVLRDESHRLLLDRFRKHVHSSIAWRFEVPIGLPGDQRAWDAMLLVDSAHVAVEAETRPRDIQALQRRLNLKRQDDRRVQAVVLLLSDTRHNRALLREHGDALRADYPVAGKEILESLASGRCPAESGVVMV